MDHSYKFSTMRISVQLSTIIKPAFKMSHCNNFVYVKAFKLMKHCSVSLITITPISSSRYNYFKRRFA